VGDLHDAMEDHFRSPVPAHRRISGWRVGLVILGIGITLPIFHLGAQLGQQMGALDAAFAFFVGCLMLGLLAAVTGYIGGRTGLSSYMIIEFAFGRRGAKLVNLLMAIGVMGYYSMTADIFGRTVQEAVLAIFGRDLPVPLFTLAGALLMTITAIFGFRAIERMSLFAVPLMAMCMIYAVILTLQRHSLDPLLAPRPPGAVSLGLAISTIIGSAIQCAVLMPDAARFARDGRQGIVAVWGLALGFPIVFLAAAIPALVTGETSLMLMMLGLGLAGVSLFTLVFATWTTNTVNLYSTSMTLATIVPKVREWKLTLAASIVGTSLALVGVIEQFVPFLLLLGVATPPVAGIYIADFFLLRRGHYRVEELDGEPPVNWAALANWLLASTFGLMESQELIALGTGVPSVDSLLLALFIYVGLRRAAVILRQHRHGYSSM